MSFFLLNMLALAGIEILIGVTAIGTLLATIGFFIGDLREKKASGAQLKKSSAEGKDIKVLEPKITPTVKKKAPIHGLVRLMEINQFRSLKNFGFIFPVIFYGSR